MKNMYECKAERYKNWEVRMIDINGVKMALLIDVSRMLGYKDPKRSLPYRISENKIAVQIKDRLNRRQNAYFITQNDVVNCISKSQIISESEKIDILNWFKDMGVVEGYISTISRKEIEFKSCLFEVFSSMGVEIMCQYQLYDYRLDFYIPSLNIVIEYDENEHRCYDKTKELKRENIIKKSLKCKIIRVSDNKSNMENIGIIMKSLLSTNIKY